MTASFFELGGHSLGVVRLLNRVRETLHVDYPVLRFFRTPTIRAMAVAIREMTDPVPSGGPRRTRGTL